MTGQLVLGTAMAVMNVRLIERMHASVYNMGVSLLLCISGRPALNSSLTVSVNTNSVLATKREYWHKQLATGSHWGKDSKYVGQTIRSTGEKMLIKTAEREGGQGRKEGACKIQDACDLKHLYSGH